MYNFLTLSITILNNILANYTWNNFKSDTTLIAWYQIVINDILHIVTCCFLHFYTINCSCFFQHNNWSKKSLLPNTKHNLTNNLFTCRTLTIKFICNLIQRLITIFICKLCLIRSNHYSISKIVSWYSISKLIK